MVKAQAETRREARSEMPSLRLRRRAEHLQLAARDAAALELLGVQRLEIVPTAYDHRAGAPGLRARNDGRVPDCPHRGPEVKANPVSAGKISRQFAQHQPRI